MDQATDLLKRMDWHVSEWKDRDDARHVFLGCYRLMTGGMVKAIKDEVFYDRQWITELLHRFAGY